jgi:ubiquinone/menaquinone biosynthesis C-methylase UbiE
MTVTRGKYAGVLGILQYNAHYYAASLCAMLGIGTLLWFRILPPGGKPILTGAAAIAVFWSLGSLVASYYVYDYVGVTRWNWISRMLLSAPHKWLNIHAGLDESTAILIQLFPNTEHVVLDIYDSREMTERSIARARRALPSAQTAVAGKLDALPLPDRSHDTLFLLFTAHEIRHPERRADFFRETARVLANSGQLVLVEHLRDWKNFAAFGPGFLHFYSRDEWLRVARKAGLTLMREDCVTPFVRCFLMTKAGA